MQENLTAKFSLLIVLIVGVWGAYVPVARINLERAEAHRMLQETIATIQDNLPAPSDPKRQQKMPIDINPYLRKGLRYYPERDAYKYTFNRKYEQDHRGQPGQDSGMPEPLEQRSIWWKVIDGKWHCYAGIKKHVRQELCGERAILNGLTVREHQEALWVSDNSGLAYWLRSLQLPYNTQIYYLTNKTKEADIRLNSAGRDVVLILDSAKFDDIWRIQHAPNTHIRAVISDSRRQHIYGLPPQTPVFDYSAAINQCNKEDRHCGSLPDSDSLRQMIGLGAGNVIYERIEETLKAPLQIGIDPQQSWISFPTMIQIGLSATEPIRLVEENSGIDSTNVTETQEK
ncbi:hypothetical protein [Aggregatibacter kilianii]|uniref:hypothetical protein n=1 Tax=Aggregatibacter kilianii TaxID=2025884 RepID=UPI000D64AFBC|nr:hypothetical protein [Aggregatibacter kilianii]